MFGLGTNVIVIIVGALVIIFGALSFVSFSEPKPEVPLEIEEEISTPIEAFIQEPKEQSLIPQEHEERAKESEIPVPAEGKDLQQQFAILKREITVLFSQGGTIGPDHYNRLEKSLNNFQNQGIARTEIDSLREKLLTQSPFLEEEKVRSIEQLDEESVSLGISSPSYPISPSGWSPPRGCSGDAITFTSSPVDENQITFITPLGRMNASHVTPTDHGYINVGEEDTASVRSPAAGEIVDIGAFSRPNDFRVTIWHSCTVSTIYIHLTHLAPEIRAHVGDLQPGDNWFAGDDPLYISAGQIIGTMRRSVDFSVHDTNVILSGFVTPSLYYGEAWKIHTVDLYDYFAEPLRTVLRGKSERTVAPIGGKIDHDVDGRLVGNWFLAGTSGYSGGPGDYWLTHLAIAYDHVTPNVLQISDPNSGINDQEVCNVCFNVYGVKGNAPDPANVSVASGLVKYELLAREHVDNPRTGGRMTVNDENRILGVFLVQMLSDRRIQVEVFPGKRASGVFGFTSAAMIYER